MVIHHENVNWHFKYQRSKTEEELVSSINLFVVNKKDMSYRRKKKRSEPDWKMHVCATCVRHTCLRAFFWYNATSYNYQYPDITPLTSASTESVQRCLQLDLMDASIIWNE